MISPASHRALDALRRLVRALVSSTHALEQSTGITSAQRFVLEQLVDGPLPSVNALAARTHTTQATVSVVLTKLERRGLIGRERDPADRRRATVTLTRAGRRLLDGSTATVQSRLAAALGEMRSQDVRVLATSLERWVEEAGLDRTKAGMFLEPDRRGKRRRLKDA